VDLLYSKRIGLLWLKGLSVTCQRS